MSPTRPESKIFGFFDIIHGYKNFFSSLMDNICCNPDTKNSWSKKDFLDLHEKTNSEITPLFRQDYNNSNITYHLYVLVPAAEIRDHETGLVSGPFFWFQSRQLFPETHETEANSTSYLSILTLSILYYVQTYYFQQKVLSRVLTLAC